MFWQKQGSGNEIRNLIGEETFSVWIADSTTVKTDRLYSPTMIECRRKKKDLESFDDTLAPQKNNYAS